MTSNRSARRAALALSAVLFGGCGEVTHDAVPVELMEHATVPGMPDGIRAWGDEYSPAFQASVVRSAAQARAAYSDHPPTDVLAISGGGSNGPFGAGLLCGWTDRGDRPTFRLVTGVSAGAILAPFAFLGPAYDHQMRRMATTLSNDQVFQSKGLLTAFTSDSLTDTRPLAEFLGKFYDAALLRGVAAEHAKGRRLLVATTDLVERCSSSDGRSEPGRPRPGVTAGRVRSADDASSARPGPRTARLRHDNRRATVH